MTLAHLQGLKDTDYMKGKPWDDPAFKAALTAALKPKATLARLTRSGPVTGPLAHVDGAIHVWGCRAHNCSSIQAQVFIEAAANRLSVCWHDEETDAAHDWWLVAGKAPEALDPGLCKDDQKSDGVFRAHSAH